MNKKELIKCDKIKDFEAQVFGQHLTPQSKDTFTAVLSEDEEIAVAEKIISGSVQSEGWQKLFAKYNDSYPLSNCVTRLMIENLENPLARQVLIKETKKWGLSPDMFVSLCQKAIECELDITAIIVDYVKDPHTVMMREDILLRLCRYDDLMSDKLEVKFAPQYKKFFNQ